MINQRKCSATILISADSKIIYQRRDEKPNILYPGHLSLIAGIAENGEDPAEAAYRELHEELLAKTEKIAKFTFPLFLFSFLTINNILEYVHLSSTNIMSNDLHILEGAGIEVADTIRCPINNPIAPHHKYAVEYFAASLYAQYCNPIQKGCDKMKIKNYFTTATIGQKKDYSTMTLTGGFVDKVKGPIASIIPEEPVHYIALLEFSNGIPRGNHYHYSKVEYMVVLEGTLKCKLELEQETEEVLLQRGQTIRILPECIHTYTAINGDVVALEYSPQKYNSEDTVSL